MKFIFETSSRSISDHSLHFEMALWWIFLISRSLIRLIFNFFFDSLIINLYKPVSLEMGTFLYLLPMTTSWEPETLKFLMLVKRFKSFPTSYLVRKVTDRMPGMIKNHMLVDRYLELVKSLFALKNIETFEKTLDKGDKIGVILMMELSKTFITNHSLLFKKLNAYVFFEHL